MKLIQDFRDAQLGRLSVINVIIEFGCEKFQKLKKLKPIFKQ